jgi:hypothetical protein
MRLRKREGRSKVKEWLREGPFARFLWEDTSTYYAPTLERRGIAFPRWSVGTRSVFTYIGEAEPRGQCVPRQSLGTRERSCD